MSRHALTVLLVGLILPSLHCATNVDEPTPEGADPGKADGAGESDSRFEMVEVVVDPNLTPRCICHPGFFVRVHDRDERLPPLTATLVPDVGEPLTVTVRGPMPRQSEPMLVRWPDASWNELYVVLSLDTFGDETVQEAYRFVRSDTDRLLSSVGERVGLDTIPGEAPQLVSGTATSTAEPIPDSHVTRLDFGATIANVESGRMRFRLLVRDADPSAEAVDWGVFDLDFREMRDDGAYFEKEYELSQDPGDPDPTGAMEVILDELEVNGRPTPGRIVIALEDGYPVATRVEE